MAHESSRSQGKGSRRWPGRPGGAHKRKAQEWEHQASRCVATVNEIPRPVALLTYPKPWGKTTSESIYMFDQEAAKTGITYYAEYRQPVGMRWFAFLISVNEKDRDAAQRIIDRLRPLVTQKRSGTVHGWWRDIEPSRVAKSQQDHPWRFARYGEMGNERDDGLRYVAFLFRNEDRTIFGIKEWLGDDAPAKDDVFEKLAHRVITDREFRNSLVSDDPDLPQMWKKR